MDDTGQHCLADRQLQLRPGDRRLSGACQPLPTWRSVSPPRPPVCEGRPNSQLRRSGRPDSK
eukprot:7666731-Pyramimonas_sp.AAC.1